MAVSNDGWLITFTAGSDAVTGRFYVKYFLWENVTTDGDDLIIKDASGAPLANVKWDTNEGNTPIYIERMVNGITIDTLDSGRVVAYIG